jgi:hypothetical protein
MRDSNSDHEDSVSEEEQQMANALLSPTPGVSFPQLPEVPRRSSKRLLSESSEDPSQSEKRRKALTLLVETRTAKSLKLADPGKVAFSSEPTTKDCFSMSSGIYLQLLLLCLHILVKNFADQHFFSYSVGSDLQDLSSPSSGCLMKSIRIASGYDLPPFLML